MQPIGGYVLCDQDIDLCPGRRRIQMMVANGGDRPIQVGSHYHFFEVNPALQFEREKTFGMRLDIPSGTSVRFEPGMSREVSLVVYGGHRVIRGFRHKVCHDHTKGGE